jgi:hypothetical protein
MTPPLPDRPGESADVRIAIVLDGVSDKWQTNILPVLGQQTVATLNVEGRGEIDAPAIRLSREQARHLATQITELLER